MARPWETIERVDTGAGPLELRRRGQGDYLITIDGRVLMNSRARRSEEALARLALEALGPVPAPRVVIGGLGMGCTLRAALDALPASARVTVCELETAVADWCRGPLAEVCGGALADPRVDVVVGDVADTVRALAERRAGARPAHAILLDLFEGPHAATDPRRDPLYGATALERTRRALAPGGVFGVWAEAPDAAFERRLGRAGFDAVAVHRPGRGGRRHAVYVARRPGDAPPGGTRDGHAPTGGPGT